VTYPFLENILTLTKQSIIFLKGRSGDSEINPHPFSFVDNWS
jgi:hypothetical protein